MSAIFSNIFHIFQSFRNYFYNISKTNFSYKKIQTHHSLKQCFMVVK